MKQIIVSDMTLSTCVNQLSFKEKIEIARHLDNLKVDVIDMPQIKNVTADSLLIKTISAFVKNSVLSVEVPLCENSVETAYNAISKAKKGRLKISIPVSTVLMEYTCHKKPNKVLELCGEVIKKATELCNDVEIFLIDATRADAKFLKDVIETAVSYGVKTVTLCDDEGVMLSDEFACFISNVKKEIDAINKAKIGILCKNTNGLAMANSLMAIKAGVDEVKTCVGVEAYTKTDLLASVISNTFNKLNANINLNMHELHRIINQIEWVLGAFKGEKKSSATNFIKVEDNENTVFDSSDTKETLLVAVKKLGYDLSEDDALKVYEEFKKVASRKTVGIKELDAIVAGVALQVPPTYSLKSFVINNGNVISSSAQITLIKNGKEYFGVCIGDGPVDAAFKALEQIIGTHYELDDFQIQSVTEGREAMGFALVKLRYNGKVYSGNGISTDIIGSSISAYINAVNKIVYGEV